MYQQLIAGFVKQEQLPASYREDATRWFLPLAEKLEARLGDQNTPPLVVGINGAQGTGKSTLAKLLALLLENKGWRSANLSIDDFYLSKARRLALADKVHPLLASRGVPGTHDMPLVLHVMQDIKNLTAADNITLPRFDKAADDIVHRAACPSLRGPVDIIILEGWFIGAKPQQELELQAPINQLEALEDSNRQWREFVNQQLAREYQHLFSQIDLLVMLAAPSFDQVFEWRCLQEDKLRQNTEEDSEGDTSGLMNDMQIQRFIDHFERLTRHCLHSVKEQADMVFLLDKNHRVSAKTSG